MDIDIVPSHAQLQHPLGKAKKKIIIIRNGDIEGTIREAGKQGKLVSWDLRILRSFVASSKATEITLWSLVGFWRAEHEDT